MKIGLIDVDGKYPNFALMKISAYHKMKGDSVEWANRVFGEYDKVYSSKVFTFTPDWEYIGLQAEEIRKGGTGYDISLALSDEIEKMNPDYSIYPKCDFSIQFFSRGCIRNCPFCLVRKKEGWIKPVDPVGLNPKGEWIEVLDNNFFANPEWDKAIVYLIKQRQPINLHGVDVRLMNEEQAYWLNKLRLKQNIKIAWDLPNMDLTNKLKEITRYIKPYKLTCYVLVGFNSTIEQDLHRLNTLKELKITPFVQPYRDFKNERTPSNYEIDLARWANRTQLFKSFNFEDYEPRKGFKCKEYL